MCLLFIGFIIRNSIGALFGISGDLFFIALLISSLSVFVQIEFSYLQSSLQSSKYALLAVARNIVLTIVAVIWIQNLEVNRYLGKVYSQLLVTAIIALFSVYQLFKLSKFNIQKKHIQYSLAFGLPLIPHALSNFILAEFDRMMLNTMSGSYETGIYSFAYNIGILMMVVVSALGQAQGPIMIEYYNDRRFDKIQNLLNNSSKLLFFTALGLIIFSPEIIGIVASREYLGGDHLFIWYVCFLSNIL